jgi:large subunit ribosomal protein L15
MKLNQLRDNPGARKAPIRVGRGIGSGKGKTGGRGGKGQTARTGVALNGYEGGQMPLHRRLPKRGFNNIFRLDYVEVNLGAVQKALDAGKLDAGKKVDGQALRAAGLTSRLRDGVVLLAKGPFAAKLEFEVERASGAAIAAVEKAGGKVVVLKPKKVFEPKPDKAKEFAEKQAAQPKAEPKAAKGEGKAEAKQAKAEGKKAEGKKPEGKTDDGKKPKA